MTTEGWVNIAMATATIAIAIFALWQTLISRRTARTRLRAYVAAKPYRAFNIDERGQLPDAEPDGSQTRAGGDEQTGHDRRFLPGALIARRRRSASLRPCDSAAAQSSIPSSAATAPA
jgi:hypothetical protein